MIRLRTEEIITKNSVYFIKNNETNEMAIFVIVAKIFPGSYLKKKCDSVAYFNEVKKILTQHFPYIKKNKHKY